MGMDEFKDLRPVADLRRHMLSRIYLTIQNPVRWEGPEPSEEEWPNEIDDIAASLGKRLLDLSERRLWWERFREWRKAYYQSGWGSTSDQADIILDDIYVPAAPCHSAPDRAGPDYYAPARAPDPDGFVREVVAEFEAAAKEVGARLQ